jgi:signal transduction histidine kinase
LSVEADGVGADLALPRAGLGLIGLAARGRALGGRREIASRPGQGTALRVIVPVPERAREEAVLEGLAG